MPLAMARLGEKVVIREMTGGRTARSRLTSLGLLCGDLIEVINNDNNGRLVVAHNTTRLALGRGIAGKIMVSIDRTD